MNKYRVRIRAAHKYIESKKERAGYYCQVIHAIACGIKSVNEKELRQIAARDMARLIPKGALLIPIPSSKNDTKPNFLLAKDIAKIINGKVLNVLKRERTPGKTGWELRRAGLPGPDPRNIIHKLCKPIPKGAILIDNVATTGATLESAGAACGVSVSAVVWAMGRTRVLRRREDVLRARMKSLT